MRLTYVLIATLFALSSVATEFALADGNWPHWRGPQDSGSVESGVYPTEWTPAAALWKSELPGKGCSTPIVWGGRIYVTAPSGGRDALLAYGGDGKQLWKTEFGAENPGKHRNGSGCNPSPVTDGESVYVNFKSGTLAAVDLNGTVRWQTNLVERFGRDTLFWDHGTSPVLTDRYVVMVRMHKGESWLAAFDKSTGEMRWKTSRNYQTPVEGDHGYATPLVIRYRDAEAILVWGAEHLTIHDVEQGQVVWSCGGFNPESNDLWPSIATPVICGDIAIVAYGRNDRGIPRLHGIRLSGEGDVTKSARLWVRDDVGTFVPTPVSYRGKAYVLGDQGRVECIDPKTGDTVWRGAFPKHRSKYYASPLIAAGKLYAPREDGAIFVAEIADKFKLVSENKMGESIIASPVPTTNKLLIRGEKTLFCFGVEAN